VSCGSYVVLLYLDTLPSRMVTVVGMKKQKLKDT
jgi:hypothetical protein